MFAGSRLLLPVSINFITLVPKPGRKEGHAVSEPSLLRGIAVLRRSGSRKKRRSPVAARSGGAGAMEEQVGRKTRCRAPGSRRGGCRPRGSGGVGAVRQWAGACCHPPGWWRSRERGTRCRLPSTGGAIAVRQEAEEHRAVHQRGPVPSHGTASEPLSWLRTERQCVREPDRDFFFSLSPLSSLSLLILPSPFLSPRLSLPPGTPRPPWRAPPGRGGRGGVERSLGSTPRLFESIWHILSKVICDSKWTENFFVFVIIFIMNCELLSRYYEYTSSRGADVIFFLIQKHTQKTNNDC